MSQALQPHAGMLPQPVAAPTRLAVRRPAGGWRAAEPEPPSAWRDLWHAGLALADACRPMPRRLPARVQAAHDATEAQLAGRPVGDGLAALRAALRRDGLAGAQAGCALAHAAHAMQATLGLDPYPTQRLAAWHMLQGRLVEMATGEGKTLATALAAGVAALAGWPVQVLTANDYLVQRDLAHLRPYYDALGLRAAAVTSATGRAERQAAWRSAVVHATARELAFDHLKDRQAAQGLHDDRLRRARQLEGSPLPPPLVPVLGFALIDEADSILLDEAVVPLVLAQAGAAVDEAGSRRALAMAQGLARDVHWVLHGGTEQPVAVLTEAGRQALEAGLRTTPDAAPLRPLRRAVDLVQAALTALHGLQRDRHYVLRDGRVALIDACTGRIAEGRQWSGALHPMVELKEGLVPSPVGRTAAQITYQRYLPRHARLGGSSGTLREARAELRACYGLRVVRVPLARPDRATWWGERVLPDRAAVRAAVAERVRRLQADGRPVLVGTDSVAASAAMSAALQAAGIAHQVLDAANDADEAGHIARAGRAGCVTVSTNIAGRGTDIRLDDAARACGGLHVIACMRNRARRIDRQLTGRSARHGDPGSAEAIVALADAHPWLAAAARLLRCPPAGRLAIHLTQRLAEARDRDRRRALRAGDHRLRMLHAPAGDPE